MAQMYLELTANVVCDAVEGLTGVTDAGDALVHVKAGYRRFLDALDARTGRAYFWSFLQPLGTISIWETATGAASGAPSKDNGTSTVTSAAAMFDEGMIGHNVEFTATENEYEITAYTSSTVVTVSGDASGEADADVITVTADGIYPLPTDFGGLIDPFEYQYNSTLSRPALEEVSPGEILKGWRDTETEGTPRKWAVVPAEFTSTTGQRYKVLTYPVTEDDRTWNYRYLRLAVDITDASTAYFLGGALHSYCIRECALAEAEASTGATDGIHQARAQTMLMAAIDQDRALFATHSVESLADGD